MIDRDLWRISLIGGAAATLMLGVGIGQSVAASDLTAARNDDDTAVVTIVSDDDDDDDTRDDDDVRNDDDTRRDNNTNNTNNSRDYTGKSRASNDNTRSNFTPVSRDRDRSRGDKTRDWTRDGGDRTRDFSRNLTNDNTRNDTR